MSSKKSRRRRNKFQRGPGGPGHGGGGGGGYAATAVMLQPGEVPSDEQLEAEAQAETTKVQDGLQQGSLELDEIQIAPKKSEINVSGVTLVWQPWIVRMDGAVEAGV